MLQATLTSKGQITLPKALRDALGLTAGDKVLFTAEGDVFRLARVSRDAREIKGLFAGRRAKALTVAQIRAAAARGAVTRFRDATARSKGGAR
jgi:antitoxin PrlF